MHLDELLLAAVILLATTAVAVLLFKRLGLGSVLGFLVEDLRRDDYSRSDPRDEADFRGPKADIACRRTAAPQRAVGSGPGTQRPDLDRSGYQTRTLCEGFTRQRAASSASGHLEKL